MSNSGTLKKEMPKQFTIFRYNKVKSRLEIHDFDLDTGSEELQKAVRFKLLNPKQTVTKCLERWPWAINNHYGNTVGCKISQTVTERPLTPIDPRTRVESQAIVSYTIKNTHGIPKEREVRYYLDTRLPTES